MLLVQAMIKIGMTRRLMHHLMCRAGGRGSRLCHETPAVVRAPAVTGSTYLRPSGVVGSGVVGASVRPVAVAGWEA